MPRIRYARGRQPHYELELFSWNMLPSSEVVGVAAIAENWIVYVPVVVPVQLTVNILGTVHRDNAAGNIYLALYDADITTTPYEPNNRLAVTPSTANNGINRRQNISVTDFHLSPGLYFLAQIQSDGAATFNNVARAEYLAPLAILGSFLFSENLGGYVQPPAVATPIQATASEALSLYMIASSIP